MRWRADLAITFVAFVWGVSFVLNKRALDDIPVLLYLSLRFTLAAALMAVIYRRQLAEGFSRQQWIGGLATGALLMTGFILQTAGLVYTTPAKSAFLTGLYAVLIPILTMLVLRKVPGIMECLGVLVATCGMYFMSVPPGTLHIATGDLLTIASAVFYALQIMTLGYFAPRTGYVSISLLQVSAACVIAWLSCGISLLGSQATMAVRWTPQVWLAIVVGGVFCTAIAFTAQSWAQQFTTNTRAALLMSLELVFAWFTSYIWDGEVLSLRSGAGAVLILAGILLVELKPSGVVEHPSNQAETVTDIE